MGFWGKIFGSDNVINKGIDAIVKTGDALVFTGEEKSQYKLALMKAYEPFKLLQRLMVLVFIVPFALLHSAVIVGMMFEMEWGHISSAINDAFSYPVSAAVTLYLTGGVLEGGIGKFKRQ